MIKRLLLSAVAAVAMAFSANADTYDMLPSFGSAGWESSYDAATHTITFDDAWKGRGWWLDGADNTDYDEIVVKFEPVTYTVQLVIEYTNGKSDNDTFQAQKGETEVVGTLDPTLKNSIKQIYLQNSAAGTLTLTAAYLQNAAVFDPKAPVVLWEGNTNLAWSGENNTVEISIDKFVKAKTAAGDKLQFTYTASEGNGFKVLYVDPDWKWTIMPMMATIEGYNAQYETIYLPTEDNTYVIPLDAENAAICTNTANKKILIQGDLITLTKVTLLRAGATGISDIAVDNENAPVEYFNLQGVRIAEPAAGQVVIRRQGTKVQKVFVK